VRKEKQCSTSVPLNAVMMIQCFGRFMYNRGKGTDRHIQNMEVSLGFHPNQMQINTVF